MITISSSYDPTIATAGHAATTALAAPCPRLSTGFPVRPHQSAGVLIRRHRRDRGHPGSRLRLSSTG